MEDISEEMISFELGDIIRIVSPMNNELNDKIFIITYLDNEIIEIKNPQMNDTFKINLLNLLNNTLKILILLVGLRY